MDRDRLREIEKMRMESGRSVRSYEDHMSGMNPGIFFLFRCFLAAAFLAVGIIFPGMPDKDVPEVLKRIPEYIAVDYTMKDVTLFLEDLK